jgi:uncharacterized protein (TIGR03067 family)
VQGLQGAWAPIAASVADKSLRVEDLRVRYLLLHAGEYRIVDASNHVVDRGHYRLHEQRSPPAIDIIGEAGPHAGRTMLAIYELRGDELTVCYDLERPERPASLEPHPGQPKLRITYTRAPIASS